MERREAVVNHRFRLIFFSVMTITVLCGLMAVALALLAPINNAPLVERLFSTLLQTFTLGVGAIFALLSVNK
jgi:hypothetical protein